jgi:class 3 adenylate cyclase
MERRLAAILVADVAGFSRLAGADEEATLASLERLRLTVVDPTIAEHGGRVFKTTGDGLLAAFPSVVEAVRCAVRIQQALAAPREAADVDSRLALRIAVHVGDVVVSDNDLLGDGVNIAARLEQLAEPGGICVSGAVHEQVRDRLPLLRFADGGEHALRNIVRPLRIWRLDPPVLAAAGEHPLAVGPAPAALPQRPPASDRLSLAILPFANLSGDAADDYFSDGITAAMISRYARLRSARRRGVAATVPGCRRRSIVRARRKPRRQRSGSPRWSRATTSLTCCSAASPCSSTAATLRAGCSCARST